MKNLFFKTSAFTTLACASSLAYGAIFSITPEEENFTEIVEGRSGVLVWEVENMVNKDPDGMTPAEFHPLEGVDVSQITANNPRCDGVLIPNVSLADGVCQEITDLHNRGGTCHIKLCVEAEDIGNGTPGSTFDCDDEDFNFSCGPVMCIDPEDDAGCNVPYKGQDLDVTVISGSGDLAPLKFLNPASPSGLVCDLTLIADETFTWVIQNDPTDTPPDDIAHGIRGIFPDDIFDQFSFYDESDCADRALAPGDFCEITATVTNPIEQISSEVVQFEGVDTTTLNCNVQIGFANPLVIVNNCLTFDEPGTQALLLQNTTPVGTGEDITIDANAITFPNVFGVTVNTTPGAVPNECPLVGNTWTVPAGSECNIAVIASAEAYIADDNPPTPVNGEVVIPFTIGDVTGSVTGCLSVTDTAVLINGGETINLTGSTGTFDVSIKVIGGFDWQAPRVTLNTLPNLTGVTILTDGCSSPTVPVEVDDTCHVILQFNNPTGSGTLVATGANLDPNTATTQINAGEVTITLGNPNNQHLQYQEIDICNNTTGKDEIFVNEVEFSNNLLGDIKLCDATDFTCNFRSSCPLNGGGIASGDCCSLVLQSLDNNDDPFSTTGTVMVELIDTLDNTFEATFDVLYEVNAYAAGDFSQANGTVTANSIAKWNRNTGWSNLNNGLSGEGLTMVIYHGDLLVGGDFSNADNVAFTSNVAFWTGTRWSSTSRFTPDDEIRSLVVDADDGVGVPGGVVFAGGEFKFVNSESTPSIAQYDGFALLPTWDPLGEMPGNGTDPDNPADHVNALAAFNNNSVDILFAGGDFDEIGLNDVRAGNIAGWDDTDWDTLGPMCNRYYFCRNGTNRPVHALFVDNNLLWVGGEFTRVHGENFLNRNLRANRIAVWNGDNWERVGENQRDINDTVRAITSFKDAIYIGGDFANPFPKAKLFYVAFLNIEDEVWETVGTSIDDDVLALTGHGKFVYAGGEFIGSGASPSPLNHVGRSLGGNNDWTPLDGGITSSNARVNSLLVAPSITLSIPPR